VLIASLHIGGSLHVRRRCEGSNAGRRSSSTESWRWQACTRILWRLVDTEMREDNRGRSRWLLTGAVAHCLFDGLYLLDQLVQFAVRRLVGESQTGRDRLLDHYYLLLLTLLWVLSTRHSRPSLAQR
jgi:hypothetical protein